MTRSIGLPILCAMDWKNIISEITAAGYTQAEIADFVGISQPSVCDIANGKTKSPAWQIGDALLRMRKKAASRRARQKAAA